MPASQTIWMPEAEWLYIFPPLADTSPPNAIVAFGSDWLDSAIDAFGLRWRAVVAPLLAKIGDTECLTVPSHKAVARLHTGKILGLVSSGTTIVHHLEFFQQIEPFLAADKLLIEDAGMLYGGKVVLLRLRANLIPISSDVTMRLVMSMSYDGSRPPALTCFASNRTWGVDIPCGEVPIKTVNGMPQVPADLMEYLEAYADADQGVQEQMLNTSAQGLVSNFWEDVYRKKQKTTTTRLTTLYGHLLQFYPESKWLAVMAVCIYEDYKLYFSAQEQDRRTDQCLFGIGAKIKNRAMNLSANQ